MNTDQVEKLSFTPLTQEVMRIIRIHCRENENKELEKDLFQLIESIEKTQEKHDKVKELAFVLANKL
jgi:hypothetical protein